MERKTERKPQQTGVSITATALFSALETCRNTHPDEFIGMFAGRAEGNNVVAEELVVAPLARYEPAYSEFDRFNMPIAMNLVATIHSHPNGVLRPSRADLTLYATYARVHFIAGPPYTPRYVAAFDRAGKPVDFVIKMTD